MQRIKRHMMTRYRDSAG